MIYLNSLFFSAERNENYDRQEGRYFLRCLIQERFVLQVIVSFSFSDHVISAAQNSEGPIRYLLRIGTSILECFSELSDSF